MSVEILAGERKDSEMSKMNDDPFEDGVDGCCFACLAQMGAIESMVCPCDVCGSIVKWPECDGAFTFPENCPMDKDE